CAATRPARRSCSNRWPWLRPRRASAGARAITWGWRRCGWDSSRGRASCCCRSSPGPALPHPATRRWPSCAARWPERRPAWAGQGAQLVVRDTGLDPERAARGVAELTREEAVIGIVGAAEKKAAGATFAQAAQDGIPLLVLDDAAPGALTTAFQIIHAPEARV